jgi:hypothetical protein
MYHVGCGTLGTGPLVLSSQQSNFQKSTSCILMPHSAIAVGENVKQKHALPRENLAVKAPGQLEPPPPMRVFVRSSEPFHQRTVTIRLLLASSRVVGSVYHRHISPNGLEHAENTSGTRSPIIDFTHLLRHSVLPSCATSLPQAPNATTEAATKKIWVGGLISGLNPA